MALTKFKFIKIKLDRADMTIAQQITAKVGAVNGNGIELQLVNGSIIEDTTGVAVYLNWKHQTVGNQGSEPFTLVDATNGIYRVTYPTELLSGGLVDADIKIVDGTSITMTTQPILIKVAAAATDSTLQSANAWNDIQTLLVAKINHEARITTLENPGGVINTATEKTTPVDTDMIGLMDSAAGGILKKLTWANIKATLKTYFDTIYNLYTHPTEDGNRHVPTTGTTNNKKVLKAGSTAASEAWGSVNADEVVNVPAGGIASTDVQAAINELDTEKAPILSPTFTTQITTPLVVTNGIKFPAVQVPSADPNTLDDYEEGTFLPTLIGTVTAGVGTYTTQLGKYIKIGNSVRVDIYMAWTAHTGTGDARIGGLPFSVNNGDVTETAFIESYNYACPANALLMAQIINGTNTMQMLFQTLGGGTWGTVALDTNATLLISISYKTN